MEPRLLIRWNGSTPMKLVSVIAILLPLLLTGCGGGGNKVTFNDGASAPAPNNAKQSIEVQLDLDKLFIRQARRKVANQSKVQKSLFPNLANYELVITAPGLPTETHSIPATQNSTSLRFIIGFVYSIEVRARALNGSLIAQGRGNLNLEVAPQDNVVPRVALTLEAKDQTAIISSVYPEGGSILPGQSIYLYLNQPGSLHVSVNGGPFNLIEGIPSTAGQQHTAQNGTPFQVSGTEGDIIQIRYGGEDVDGVVEDLNQVEFQLVRISGFQPLQASAANSPVMTSENYGVAQLLPVQR